jgi:hypothetical protein
VTTKSALRWSVKAVAFLRRKSKSDAEVRPVDELPAPPSIASVEARTSCRIRGTITRMKSRPAVGLPSLAVQITDDTGSVTAVWTGRRSIGGIKMGGLIELEGVALGVNGKLEFLNPAYTLLPAATH